MQVWQRPIRLVRVDNWWAKIPPLLAVAYAEALLRQLSARPLVSTLAGLLVSIFSVAAYGHVINDLYDIEADRMAGKRNAMAGLSTAGRAAAVVVTLVVGWIPFVWTGWGPLSAGLLAVNYLLPTLYSIPPVRLKERGAWGMLADASGAHIVPTLLVISAFGGLGRPSGPDALLLAVAATTSAFFAGIRGILRHQLADRAGDIRAGVSTLATQLGPEQLAGYLQWVYPGEIVALGLYAAALNRFSQYTLPVVVVFGLLEAARLALDWQFRFQPDQRDTEHYRPLVNNVFYELWLPLTLAVELALRRPNLVWLPVVELAAFGRATWHELRDVAGVAASLLRPLLAAWQATYWNRQVRQWHPVVWGDLRVKIHAPRSQGTAVRVTPAPGGGQGTVQLSRQPLPVAEGASYRFRFRARADQPIWLEYGLSRPEPAARGLGLSRRTRLGSGWQTFLAEFTATEQCPDARLFFQWADPAGTVELAEVSLEPLGTERSWRIVTQAPSSAQRVVDEASPEVLCIHVERTAPEGWIEVRQDGYVVAGGHPIRLTLRARAEHPQVVEVALKDSQPPWLTLGLSGRWSLGPEWQTLMVDGQVPRDSNDAMLVLRLGQQLGALLVSGAEISQSPEGPQWLLAAEPPSQGFALAAAEHAGRRLISQTPPGSSRSAVRWMIPGQAVQSGRLYRCTIRARGDAERPLVVDLVRAVPPWPGLGLWGRLQLTRGWRDYSIEFRASGDEPEAHLRLLAGGDATAFEVSELALAPCDEHPWWSLDPEHSAGAWLELDETGAGCQAHFSRGARAEDFVRLSCGDIPVEAGRWQRLTVTIKAGRLETAVLRVTDNQPPWTPLTGDLRAELAAEPRTLVLDFHTPLDVNQVRLVAECSSIAGAVQWSRPGVRSIEAGQAAQLETQTQTAAQLESVDDEPEWIQARVTGGFGEAAAALVTLGAWPIEPGQNYRLMLRARAEAPRGALVRVSGAAPPWPLLAGDQTVWLDRSWQTLLVEFTAPPGLTDARLAVGLAGSSTTCQFEQPRLERLARAELWQLQMGPHCAGCLRPVDSDPGAVRVLVHQEGPSEQVSLVRPGLAFEAGRVYRVTVRARADAPRELIVRLAQDRPPWEALTADHAFQLAPTWRTLAMEFRCPEPAPEARMVVAPGPGGAAVEVSAVEVRALEQRGALTLECADSRRGQLECPHGSDRHLRVRFSSPGDSANELAVVCRLTPVVAGRWYRLAVDLRAAAPRTARLRVGQARAPWKAVSADRPLWLDNEWRRVICDFQAERDEPDVRFWLGLGKDTVDVEIDGVEFTQLGTQAGWSLDAPPGLPAQLEADAVSPEAMRVWWAANLANASFSAEKSCRLVVWQPVGRLVEGRAYRLTFRAHSQVPQTIRLRICQAHEPWDSVTSDTTVELGPEWCRPCLEFLAAADEAQVRCQLELEARDGCLEVDDWHWEPLDEASVVELLAESPGGWQLESTPSGGHLVRPLEGAVAGRLLRRLAGLGLVAGRGYRLAFRGRAEQTQRIQVRVCQDHSPWDSVTSDTTVELGPEWRSPCVEFWATADEPQVRVQLEFPSLSGRVEIADWQWQPLEGEPAGRLESDPEGGLQLEAADRTGYFVRPIGGGARGRLVWTLPGAELRAGQGYRLALHARSERVQIARLRICQAHAPWDSLATDALVEIGPDARGPCVDFLAPSDEAQVRCQLEFDGRGAALEVTHWVWTPLGGRSPWQVESDRPETAQLEGSEAADGAGIRLLGDAQEGADNPAEPTGQTSPALAAARLVRTLAPIMAGQVVRLTFRGRAEPAQACRFSLAQSHEPWQALADPATVWLSPEGAAGVIDLFPSQGDDLPRLCVEPSERPGLVEISELAREEIDPARTWRWETRAPARARRVVPAWGGRVAAELLGPARAVDDLRLLAPPGPVTGQTLYRLSLSGRADRKFPLTVSLGQAHEPWAGLGLWRPLVLGPERQTVLVDFLTTTDESQAQLAILLGDGRGMVELDEARLEPAAEPLPLLESLEGALAQFVQPPNDGWLRITIPRPGGERWHVQLVGVALAVREGERIRVATRLRADAPRRVGVVLAQAQEPWQPLDEYQEWEIGPAELPVELTFTARADCERARVLWMLGAESPPVEVGPLAVVSEGPGQHEEPPPAEGESASGEGPDHGYDEESPPAGAGPAAEAIGDGEVL